MNPHLFYEFGLNSKRLVKVSEFVFSYAVLCKSNTDYYDKRYVVYVDCNNKYYPSYYRENGFMWDQVKTKYFEFEDLGVLGDTNVDGGVNIGRKLKLKFYKLEDGNGRFIEGFNGEEKIILFSSFLTPSGFISSVVGRYNFEDYLVRDNRTYITQGDLIGAHVESYVDKVSTVGKSFSECGDFVYKHTVSPNLLELNRLGEFSVGLHVDLRSLYKK